MSLYELTGDMLAVIEGGMVVDDETGEVLFDSENFEALEGEYLDKLEGCGLYVKNLASEVTAIKDEEARLSARRKVKERKAERMKAYMLQSMEATDTKKAETPRVAISTRKSSRVVIDDETAIPKRFKQTVEKVDKSALKRVLKCEDVKGAHIEECVNLSLK